MNTAHDYWQLNTKERAMLWVLWSYLLHLDFPIEGKGGKIGRDAFGAMEVKFIISKWTFAKQLSFKTSFSLSFIQTPWNGAKIKAQYCQENTE